MIDCNLIHGKSISLVIWNSEVKNDVRIYKGEIIQKENTFYFINQNEQWQVTLTYDMLGRLKEVPENLKDMLLSADFSLSLSIGGLPDNSNEGFEPTGLKWQ